MIEVLRTLYYFLRPKKKIINPPTDNVISWKTYPNDDDKRINILWEMEKNKPK